ncbi:MAG TPA: hypothetical protein VKQ72_11180 [Aggregatilineales bacterium]|nr:hypothetical protein [Aggregatilineales bacterium]
MSRSPFEQSATSDEAFERHVRHAAETFVYPPTPDIAAPVRQRIARIEPIPGARRWLLWIGVALLIVLFVLLAVPGVRAAIVNWLRIGGVIVIPEAPTTTATPLLSAPNARPSATPPRLPSPTALQSILDLAGETTLADAQKRVKFPIRLPTYPIGLGAPDRVYLQDLNGAVVVLIWLSTSQPGGIRFALHILGPGAFVYKMEPTIIQETSLNGKPALWTEGPYFLVWRSDSQTPTWDMRRIVNGNVLIWTDAPLTYRLESDLSFAEALKIAQSIPLVNP